MAKVYTRRKDGVTTLLRILFLILSCFTQKANADVEETLVLYSVEAFANGIRSLLDRQPPSCNKLVIPGYQKLYLETFGSWNVKHCPAGSEFIQILCGCLPKLKDTGPPKSSSGIKVKASEFVAPGGTNHKNRQMTPSKSTAPPSKEIAYFGSESSSNPVSSKAESNSKALADIVSNERLSRPTTATRYNLFIGSSSRKPNAGSKEIDTGRPQGFAIFNSAEFNPSTGSNEMYNSLLFKPPTFGGSKTNQASELRVPNPETNNVNNKSPPRRPDIGSSDVRKYPNPAYHGSDKTSKGPSPHFIKLGSHTRFPGHSLERPQSSNSKAPPKSSIQNLHVPRQNGSPPSLRHGQPQNSPNPPQSNQELPQNSVNQARPPPTGPDPGPSPISPNSRFPPGSSIPRPPINSGTPSSGQVPGPSPSSPNSRFPPGSPTQRPPANPGSPPSGPDPGPSPSSPNSRFPPGSPIQRPPANPSPPPTTPYPGSQRSESPTKLSSTPQRPSSGLPPGSLWNHPNPGSPNSDSSNNSSKPGSTTQPPDPGSVENGVPPGPRYPGSGVIVRLSAHHSTEVSSEEDFRNSPSSREDENKDRTTRAGVRTTAPPSENGVHTTLTPSDRVTSKPPPASSTRKEVTVLYRPVGLLNVSFVQFNRQNIPPTSTPRTTGTTSKPSTTTLSYIQKICDGCIFERGIGYKEDEKDCNKYITCYNTGINDEIRAEVRSCGVGKYWDQSLLTCRSSRDVPCRTDPCKGKADLFSYSFDGNCRGYWTCEKGVSVGHCCERGQGYIEGAGCSWHHPCNQTCWEHELTLACNKQSVPGKPGMFRQLLAGHGYVDMHCPGGTIFNTTTCDCQYDKNAHNLRRTCKKEVEIDFTNSGLSDISGNAVHLASENVTLLSNMACFHGDGAILIPRFSNAYIGDSLEINLKFKMDTFNSKGGLQSLLYNGDCNMDPSVVVSANRDKIMFTLRNSDGVKQNLTASLAGKSDDWVDATMILYNNRMSVTLFGGEVSSHPFHGNIARSRCGLKIGWGEFYKSFHGCIDQVSMAFCTSKT